VQSGRANPLEHGKSLGQVDCHDLQSYLRVFKKRTEFVTVAKLYYSTRMQAARRKRTTVKLGRACLVQALCLACLYCFPVDAPFTDRERICYSLLRFKILSRTNSFLTNQRQYFRNETKRRREYVTVTARRKREASTMQPGQKKKGCQDFLP
jgi:hypothetical protein